MRFTTHNSREIHVSGTLYGCGLCTRLWHLDCAKKVFRKCPGKSDDWLCDNCTEGKVGLFVRVACEGYAITFTIKVWGWKEQEFLELAQLLAENTSTCSMLSLFNHTSHSHRSTRAFPASAFCSSRDPVPSFGSVGDTSAVVSTATPAVPRSRQRCNEPRLP